jgi:hypothetical protein
MIDPNWSRWMTASVANAMTTVAQSIPIPSVMDGIDDSNKTFAEAPASATIHTSGPHIQELSRDFFRVYLDVNVLVKTEMGDTTNRLNHDTICGIFQSALDTPIGVYQFGSEPDDDPSATIGCLLSRTGSSESVRIVQFGQPSVTDRVRQSVVQAHLYMYLDGC